MMEIRALVVDDSAIMRKLVMRSLVESKMALFLFTEAKDGQDAVSQFDVENTDMIFVDWNMPNMTGIEMVHEIRARQKRHVPIVMITTESTMARVEEALAAGGVDSYVIKPFTPDVVRQKVEPLLDKMAEAKKAGGSFFSKLAGKLS